MVEMSLNGSGNPDAPAATAFRTLFRFSVDAWRASPALTLGQVGLTLAEGAIPAGTLWAGSRLVNVIAGILIGTEPSNLRRALPLAGALAALVLAGSASNSVRSYWLTRLDPLVRLRQERLLLEAASRIDLVLYEQPATYDLIQRARSALGYRLSNLFLFLTRMLQQAASMVAYAGVLWAARPILALIVVLPALPSAWLKVRAAQSGYTHDYDPTPSRRLMAYMVSLLLGRATGQEVRLFGLREELLDRWRRAHSLWRAEEFGKTWTALRADIATTVFTALAYVAAIALLASLIARRQLSLGDYVVLTGAAASFQGVTQRLLTLIKDLSGDLPVLRDLQSLLDLGTVGRASAGAQPFPVPLRKGIEVRSLSFQYPGPAADGYPGPPADGSRPEGAAARGGAESAGTPAMNEAASNRSEARAARRDPRDLRVLSDINFQVKPGETISIVGPNGAGKTTLARLLLGLYRPDSGTVRYDDVDVQSMDPGAIGHACAAVFQDFARFRRPVREELAPGLPDLQSDELRLWDALEAVGLADRLRSLPDGLDTFLDASLGGEHAGVELSGGEWQKLAIARALVRDAQVLVLDEPTAALDPRAEVEVYERFLALAKGRTTFIISHRIGSARLADRILVMERGRLVEEGSHAELMASAGLYARFFEAQASWYRSESAGGEPEEVSQVSG
jgi:ATP-binding cassette, subfamily B, bacterial